GARRVLQVLEREFVPLLGACIHDGAIRNLRVDGLQGARRDEREARAVDRIARRVERLGLALGHRHELRLEAREAEQGEPEDREHEPEHDDAEEREARLRRGGVRSGPGHGALYILTLDRRLTVCPFAPRSWMRLR